MDSLFLTSMISMGALAIFFAGVLAMADSKLSGQDDPMVAEISELLPGVNCGVCGCMSCHDFAENLASGAKEPGACKVMDAASRTTICGLLGKESTGEANKNIPIVHCAAGCNDKKVSAEYKGIKTCQGADIVFGGGVECSYGCLGYGDCERACPFGALYMEDGLPRLDIAKCTGCTKCVSACPRHIIKMEEKIYEKMAFVACSSHDTLLRTKQVCSVGCIACGVCVKLSPDKAFFKVEDNLSLADYSKQDDTEGLKAIQPKCPTKVIKDI